MASWLALIVCKPYTVAASQKAFTKLHKLAHRAFCFPTICQNKKDALLLQCGRQTLKMLKTGWDGSSRTFKLALSLFMLNFLVIVVAFSTPYWLVTVPSEQLPNPKFTNLGGYVLQM